MRCTLAAGAAAALGCLAGSGCHGSPPRDTTPATAATDASASDGPAMTLEPAVAETVWYRVVSLCGQGPYELEVPAGDARWGEDIALRLATPRRIALNAVILADGAEAVKEAAVYGAGGKTGGQPENTRCVADARQRLAASRAVPGAPTGPLVETGVRVRTPDSPPPAAAVTGQLEIDRAEPPASIEIVRHGWHQPERGEPRGRFGRIKIRLWSIEPNDLEGVRFGVRRLVWRPSGTDAEYEAYLARIAAADEARRLRAEEEERRRMAEDEERRRRRPPPPPEPAVTVQIDSQAELERYRKEVEARKRREAELAAAEERRRARAAAEAERLRQRQAFCAAHPEDRGCWGAGGQKMHLALEERRRQSERYCAAAPDDARCWTPEERSRRERVWRKRVTVATAPPRQPDGPPPAPLAESIPPKLSANAEWRQGYWHWTGSAWTWLGGMWRVPEADIAAEKTTTAPEAPPPLQAEAPPPPPLQGATWIAGFWQWSGRAWIWVPGSWQLRPQAGASWRPAEWQTRGAVHVLIPGGWVLGRGGRR